MTLLNLDTSLARIEAATYNVVLRATLFLLGTSVVGTVLGIVGFFRWWLAAVGGIGCALLLPRALPPLVGRSKRQWPFGAAAVLAMVFTGISLANPGEHLLTGRDPATYLASAAWLAETGSFQIEARVGAFVGTEPLEFAVPGFYDERRDGMLSPEFFHAFPVLMAVAGQLGGTQAMLAVNPLVAGVGLLAVYLLAVRLAGARWALVAIVILGLSQVFAYFSRSPFSEPLALLFIATGVWLFGSDFSGNSRVGLLSGVILGGAVLARVDTLLLLIPMLALAVLSDHRRRALSPVLRGFLWMTGFAVVEVLLVARWYLGKFDSQFLLIGMGVVGALVAHLVPRRWRESVWRWIADRRRVVVAVSMTIVAAALVFAFAIRPQLGPSTGNPYGLGQIQTSEGLPIEPNRTYAELSLHWLNWYLGPVALALGLAGLGLLISRAMLGRATTATTVWVVTTIMVFGVYLWRPSINPDHIWATRRFLPVVIPGLAIGAAIALKEIARGRAWRAYVAGVLAAVAVGGVGYGYGDIWNLGELEGLAEDFARICQTIGDDSVVLIVDTEDGAPSSQLMQSFRSYCGFPTASVPLEATDAGHVAALADQWQSMGRQLTVVAVAPDTLQQVGVEPEGTLLAERYPILEYTLTRRPTDVTFIDPSVSFGRAS